MRCRCGAFWTAMAGRPRAAATCLEGEHMLIRQRNGIANFQNTATEGHRKCGGPNLLHYKTIQEIELQRELEDSRGRMFWKWVR